MHFSKIQHRSILSTGNIILKEEAVPDLMKDLTEIWHIQENGELDTKEETEIDCSDDKENVVIVENCFGGESNFTKNVDCLDVCLYLFM